MLNGEKIRLRPIRENDIDVFLSWYNNPDVIFYQDFYKPLTKSEARKAIQKYCSSKTIKRFVIEIKHEKGERIPVGDCGLRDIEPHHRYATLGINIGNKKYWGKGYGTEALELLLGYGFSKLKLHRINAAVLEHNKRSLKLLSKLGFHKEGRSREVFLKEGKYLDEIILGILANDWQKNIQRS